MKLAAIDPEKSYLAVTDFAAGASRAWPAFLSFVVGDVAQELSDAIVNPVGGLVDIAVQRIAGPLLLDDFHREVLVRHGGTLAAGEAVVTPGYGLAARYVIHCAPPVYADGPAPARDALAACHVEALRIARERGLASLSIPAIGTGVYRFPAAEAAHVAVSAVARALRAAGGPQVVRFVLPDEATRDLYASAVARLAHTSLFT